MLKRLAFVLALIAVSTTAHAQTDITKTDAFTSGRDGFHTYRIPALLVTPKGALLAFCEGRKTSRSDHGDIDLLLKRSTDGGQTWSPQQTVHEEGGDAKITIGNPCPVVDESTGRIWLPFTRDNDGVFVTYSDDDGVTWSPPRDITAQVKKPQWGWYATGPGVGIQLQRGPHKGRLVIPCDHRVSKDRSATTQSHVFYSDDHGETWRLGEPVAPHTNECQLAELPDGRLLINMRNYWERDGGRPDRGRRRAVAVSDDGGRTWGELRFDQTLIEPVCQASLIRYSWPEDDGGSRLLFSNPASKSGRVAMTVRMSRDEGKTWPAELLIEPGSSAYSCLARLPDGRVGILYERENYGRITFASFDVSRIE